MFSKAIAIFQIFFILSIFVTLSKSLPEESTKKISQEKVKSKFQRNLDSLYEQKKEIEDKCKKCENIKKRYDNWIQNKISSYSPEFLRSKQISKMYKTLSEYCKTNCPQHTVEKNSVQNSKTEESTEKSNEITKSEEKETKKMKRHYLEDMYSVQNNNVPLKRKIRSIENDKEINNNNNNSEETTKNIVEQRSDEEEQEKPTKKEATNENQEQTTSTIIKTTEVPLETAPKPTLDIKNNEVTTEAPTNETKLVSEHEFITKEDIEYLYLSIKYKHLTRLLIEIEQMLSDDMAAGLMKKMLSVFKSFIICILDAVFTEIEQKMGLNFPLIERKHCEVNPKSSPLFSFLKKYEVTHSIAAEFTSNNNLNSNKE